MGGKGEKEEKELGITVRKAGDFSEWYNQAVLKAELADYSAVHGCMVIRPAGYALWERIQQDFDARIKRLGVQNAYFPLFIPEEFFRREAQHAEGFEPEVAWLRDEELAVRPTSETIICDSLSRWIRSHRDLPLRLNQWCNVVRWEIKTTKLFLRTREFLWQEGHCIYETQEEADREVMLFLKEYQRLFEELLAIPVIVGRKTEREKFAGALYTTAAEALMPDGRALQMGTSHNLGQGFMRAFNIDFLGKDGGKHVPWHSSWGISTRLIGAVVMVHGDDRGLVLPPRLAPVQAVIVPILYENTKEAVLKEADRLEKALSRKCRVLVDRREYTPGWKFHEWEMKGVPLRIELGPRDIERKQMVVVRRDTGAKETVPLGDGARLAALLEDIQQSLLEAAARFQRENTREARSFSDFKEAIRDRKLVRAPFCGSAECEERIKEESGGAGSRCIPFDQPRDAGACVRCGEKAAFLAYFAKAY